MLVTGASGFIGSHLVRTLRDQGAKVIGLGRTGQDGIFKADVTRISEVEAAFDACAAQFSKPVEYVFHLAGQKSIALAKEFPADTLRASLDGTVNILELARKQSGIKRVVLFSSIAVYGTKADDLSRPFLETDPLKTDSIYSTSKIMSESSGLAYASEFGLPVMIARLANVYGPGQSEMAVIPSLVAQMLKSNKVTIGNGSASRDFIYVKDAVEAILILVLSQTVKNGVFNIGTGHSSTIQELTQTLARILDFQGGFEVEPSKVRPNERLAVLPDVRALLGATGWSSRYSLDAGLHEMVKSLK